MKCFSTKENLISFSQRPPHHWQKYEVSASERERYERDGKKWKSNSIEMKYIYIFLEGSCNKLRWKSVKRTTMVACMSYTLSLSIISSFSYLLLTFIAQYKTHFAPSLRAISELNERISMFQFVRRHRGVVAKNI